MPTRPWPAIAALILGLLATGPQTSAGKEERGDEAARELASLRRGEAYAHLMRSLFAARRGEFSAVSDEIRSALELQPDSPDLLVESARMLLLTGREVEAARLARRALELDDDHSRAVRFLFDRAMTRALASEKDTKSREEALRLYDKLVANDVVVEPRIRLMLVQLRHRAGDVEGAVRDARGIVDDRPGDAEAAKILAQLLLQSAEDEEALRVLLRHVAEHPFEEEMLGFAEQLAHSLQAWDIVAGILEPHAPFPPNFTLVHRLLGEALLRTGRMTDAADALERAQATRPGDIRTRQFLALAYRGVGRMADAAGLLDDLVIEFPGYPGLQRLLGETLELQGDPERALAAYRTALSGLGTVAEGGPIRDSIRQQMARVHLGRDELDSARAVLEELERPENAETAMIQARVSVESEDWPGARRAAKQLRSAGKSGSAALIDGEVLARQGRWSKARARFVEAIEELGPYTRSRVAEIYREGGRPEAGLELMRLWAEEQPELADARYLLAVFLYEIDRFEEAEPELREAFRLDPEHAAALNFLGYSFAERKVRLDEALELIRRALVVDPWNGAYLDSLGWVFYQMGRYDEAREPLERAARELPADPTVLEHLGDLYLRLGERARALEAWGKALDSRPEDPETLREKIRAEGDLDDSNRTGLEPRDDARADSRLQPSAPTPRR